MLVKVVGRVHAGLFLGEKVGKVDCRCCQVGKKITILCSALQSSLQCSPLSYIYIARMNPPKHAATNIMGRFKKIALLQCRPVGNRRGRAYMSLLETAHELKTQYHC